VVIIGGQIQGVEVAEFLIHRHRDVTIVDEGPAEDLGKDMPGAPRDRLINYLHTHGVQTLMGVKIDGITDEGVTITINEGLKKTLKADNIILALPLAANTALADSLKGKVKEVYAVGDCKKPGVIETGVADANLTARKI
jgi:pyruvate/2-oxoglutarate dehydrogenase complex dihydrolipoamide dehydrogenase (E3) component